MQRFLLTLFLLMGLLLAYPAIAQAHIVRPAGVYCAADTCDNVFPHATDHGSDCVSNITDQASVNLVDKDGFTEGVLHIFSSNNCHTFWGTIKPVLYMTAFTTHSYRILTNSPPEDDDTYGTQNGGFTWPNYSDGTWYDAPMVGYDGDPNYVNKYNCAHGWAHWEDRYGTWHDINTSDICVA
jgi:hypothetical protein